MLYVTNHSTMVSDADVQTMARACASQVRLHLAPLWGMTPVPVVYIPSAAVPAAAPGAWVISVMDNSDQADALGWHTEDQGDVIYGRVFAAPVLQNGGDALTKPLSVASVLSHEVLETCVDPHVSGWEDNGTGLLYAREVGDPVESDSYTIGVSTAGHTTQVTVSNFVTPHWFDPQAKVGERLDMMSHCTQPFEMTKGGYVVTMKEGRTSQVFGDEHPGWRRETKMADTSRTARRVRDR